MITKEIHTERCCDILKKYINCLHYNHKRPYICYEYLYFYERFTCI